MYRIIEEKVENLPIIPECKQLLANLIYSDVYPVLSREDKEYWESLRVEHEQSDCGNNYCVLSIPVLKKIGRASCRERV